MSQVYTSDMASTTSATVSKKPTDISPSAYAMSTTVERSAECVLAVLSSNTTIPPTYGRSISSPCGSAPNTTSPTTSGSQSPRKGSPNQNQKFHPDYESPSSLMSTSPSLSRKSYPGASSSDHSNSYQHQQQQQQEEEQQEQQQQQQQQQPQQPQQDPQELKSQEKFEDSVSNQPETKEEIIENEDDSYDCEDGPSISEDRSLTESIPDSFHTPSASIQNLSVTASSKQQQQVTSTNSSSSKNINIQHGEASGFSINNSNVRASTRSTTSSKGSDSSGHGGNGGSGGGGSTDRGSSTAISSTTSNGTSSKSDKDRDSSSINSSSSSGKNQKESPKQKKEIHTPKGSPEGAHQLHNKSPLDGPQSMGNVSPELTASVESNVSKESSGSSGKETVVIPPHHYGPKPNKKKMWYHVFYPSYKTRSGDFKRIFKDLPAEERLIVDYSCALQREILIQGRMYVSQNYISFYANIFGWETQTSIRLKDVTAITKEKTALVIPNAVQVSTESERFFFTSFVTRDATYVMLFKLWQSSLLEDTLPTKEIWKLVHSCYGDELGVASEEDAEDFLTCTSGTLVNAPSVSTLMSASDGDDSKSITDIDVRVCATEIGPGIALPLVDVVTSGEHPSGVLGLPEHGIGISGPTTDASDSSESDGEHEPVTGNHDVLTEDSTLDIPICPVLHTEGREVVNAVIPTDVDTLFTMLFTSSKFFLDFHTMRKTFDIVQSPWQQSPDGSQKIRQVSFTVTLNHVMGPKHSQVTESQVMLPVSKPGRMYAIDVESVNAGIPYADSFYVTTHFCLSRISPLETKMCVVNQIKYKKSVWKYTKGFIEKNTWAGLEEFYSNLERALKEECVKVNCISQSPPVATIIPGSAIPRRRNGRKKYPAPGIPLDVTVTPIQPLVAIMRNGSIPTASVLAVDNATVSSGSQTTAESSAVLKIILAVLACLLLLNAFLYVKLTKFETSKYPLPIPHQPISFPKNVPRNHEEWVALLQQQEDLHRLELQKWHEILISALKILHQAEEDLESLKYHITSYSNGKFSVGALKEALESIHSSSNPISPSPAHKKNLEDNLLIQKEQHEAQSGSGDEDSGTGSTNYPKSENLQHTITTNEDANIQGDTVSERTRTLTSNNINDEL